MLRWYRQDLTETERQAEPAHPIGGFELLEEEIGWHFEKSLLESVICKRILC